MAVAPHKAFGDQVSAAAKIDQPYFRPVADDDLAIGALEGGAGDDPRLLLGALAVDPSGHGLEPGPSVGIGQRNSGMHLGDIRLGMQRVAFLEGPAETRGQLLGDRRLAGPGHPHHHEDRRTAPMGARAIEAMDAGRVGHENRIGPTDEEAAFDHPDDAPDALLQPRRIGDGAEAAIENSVAAVGDEGLARRREAQCRLGAERLQPRLRRL